MKTMKRIAKTLAIVTCPIWGIPALLVVGILFFIGAAWDKAAESW